MSGKQKYDIRKALKPISSTRNKLKNSWKEHRAFVSLQAEQKISDFEKKYCSDGLTRADLEKECFAAKDVYMLRLFGEEPDDGYSYEQDKATETKMKEDGVWKDMYDELMNLPIGEFRFNF